MFKITNFLFEEKDTVIKKAAGVIFFSKKTKRFLLLLRNPSLPSGNTWSTVGGKMEKNETPKEAAIREVKEEIGFDKPTTLKLLYVFKNYYFSSKINKKVKFKYYTYIGFVNDEFIPDLVGSTHKWENIDFKWLTLEEMLMLEKKHHGLVETLKNTVSKLYKLIGK